MLLFAVAPRAVSAQTLIRDAEIENTLDRIAHPILTTAGLSPRRTQIYILKEDALNAFVAGRDDIFLFTGLLQRLETIDQLRAVIAHEAGHIVGGHMVRRNEAIKRARGTAVLGMILAAAAAAAGAPPEFSIAAGITGKQVAERGLLAHSRAEESAADQTGLYLLAASGGDPKAMLEIMSFFRGQEILSARQADEYTRTHPLWAQRLRQIEFDVSQLGPGDPPDPDLQYWHRRMVAKLDAYLLPPDRALNQYRGDDEIDILAQALAWHRRPDLAKARASMSRLLEMRPDDPYYHELDGQLRLESGDAQGAVESYRRAAELAPNEPLILSGLGRALIAIDTPAATREALEVLTSARRVDKADSMALRNLALAHARLGQEGLAALATAERMMLAGRTSDAVIHAARAQKQLPAGSPGWRQADDILHAARGAETR